MNISVEQILAAYREEIGRLTERAIVAEAQVVALTADSNEKAESSEA